MTHYARQIATLVLVALLMSGCASPNYLQTEFSVGKIIDSRVIDGGEPGPYTVRILLWTEGILIPIPITAQRELKDSYIYSLHLENGKSITTQSYKKLETGECVELWHEHLAETGDPIYTFVAGTLVKSKKCSSDHDAS